MIDGLVVKLGNHCRRRSHLCTQYYESCGELALGLRPHQQCDVSSRKVTNLLSHQQPTISSTQRNVAAQTGARHTIHAPTLTGLIIPMRETVYLYYLSLDTQVLSRRFVGKHCTIVHSCSSMGGLRCPASTCWSLVQEGAPFRHIETFSSIRSGALQLYHWSLWR